MKNGIVFRFLVPILLFTVTVLSVYGFVSYESSKKAIHEIILQQVELYAGNTTNSISRWIKRNQKDIYRMSLEHHLKISIPDTRGGRSLRIITSSRLTEYHKEFPFFEHISLVNSEGEIIASSVEKTIGNINISDQPYFKQSLTGKTVLSEIMTSEYSSKSVFVISAPITDIIDVTADETEDTKIIGCLIGVVKMSHAYSNFIESIKIGKYGYAFILNGKGLVMASRNPDEVLTLDYGKSEVGPQLLSKSKGMIFYQDRIIAFDKAKSVNWIVCIQVYKNDIFSSVNHVRNILMLISPITLILLGVGIYIMFGKIIIRPINEILEIAESIAGGNFSKGIDIRRQDEIGKLADAFRHMKDTIDHAIDVTNELIYAVREGELDTRGDPEPFEGGWRDLVFGVNNLINAFAAPIDMAAQTIDRIARGDTPEPIKEEYKGNFNDIRNNLNMLIDTTNETVRIAEEIGSGNLAVHVKERSENDRMMKALNRMAGNLKQKRDELTLTNTELKEILESLKKSQSQLIESEKMAALGQLIAGVAHEINTPLGAILSSVGNISNSLDEFMEQFPRLFRILSEDEQKIFSSLLRRSEKKDTFLAAREERKLKKALTPILRAHGLADADNMADTLTDMGVYDNIDEFLSLLRHHESDYILNAAYSMSGLQRSIGNIMAAAGRASKVVFALKSYARFDHSGKPVSEDLTQGIETVLTLYHSRLKHGIEVIRNYGQMPQILCYPDELNQIWTNIIHNAVQATEGRGTLIIDLFQEDGYAVVTFTDSGKGIPDEIKGQIFEPFFSTKARGEGSGLGLNIVKKVIEKHAGKIEVESKPGRTRFSVYIPIK